VYRISVKHNISAGHRIYGYDGKCANLHGHNYEFEFVVEGELRGVGFVTDFEDVKTTVCRWLDDNFDHRLLLWIKDPISSSIAELDKSVVLLRFNPTAENIAEHLVNVVAPSLPIKMVKCIVRETPKCSAMYSL
jgi:6-pyruvoyltetrahydropterin/6-carboxytetrahydropterin synthase